MTATPDSEDAGEGAPMTPVDACSGKDKTMTSTNQPSVREAVSLKPCQTEFERRSKAHTRHGHTKGRAYSPTYHSWQAMLARCRYPERDVENKHVGRGITLAPEWNEFGRFLADMGERPAGTTLDRIDNNRGYEPGNCRWATPREQARNTRRNRLTLETATAVAVARLRGQRCVDIAAQYQISESLPREIVRGRCWPDALAAARAIVGVGDV